MNQRLLDQAKHEYSPRQRALALALAGVFFLGILPLSVSLLSAFLDRRLALPSFSFGWVNYLVGGLLIAAGISFAWWSIYVQFTIGRGTPVPIMATQQLIIQRPYNYCRNPMTLGTIGAGLGFTIVLGSISAAAIILLLTILLLVYIRFVEEQEMQLRFGAAYEEYRKTTPFLLPHIWNRTRVK